MIELITNSDDRTHLEKIQDLFNESEEVFIMVAFLKLSGLKKIESYLRKPAMVKLIAGANFGLTEPKALTHLMGIGRESGKLTGYINCLSSRKIFHPKMYLFRSGTIGHIIIGSANLTGGGLAENNECSIYTRCNTNDQIWKNAVEYFETSIYPENADLLTERIIGLYTGFYLKQKMANDQIKEFPDVDGSLIYDLKNLKELYDDYDSVEIAEGVKEKEGNYATARIVLEKIASQKHSDAKFRELLEELVGKKQALGLWYSNGMHRQKGKIFGQQDMFRTLIKYIRNNLDKAPSVIYAGAREIMKKINGVGPNYVGEIMMTYAPEKFANINRNPITVLIKEGCANLKDHSQKFTGADYEEYNNIVKDISDKLGLKSMLAADYFFNNIYQDLKQRGELNK